MGLKDWNVLRDKCLDLGKRKTVKKLSDLCTILGLDSAIVAASLQDQYPKRELSINSRLDNDLTRKICEYFIQSVMLQINAKVTVFGNNNGLRKNRLTLKRLGLDALKPPGIRRQIEKLLEEANLSMGLKPMSKQKSH